ncbi:DUF4870 domain-containing protein [Aquisalimonas sp. 2447]|uniref:DUF4870 family protein n=1 Tax=Aquisalimonas sp. 2447 TaxID=2740807 RepID=UPI0020C329BC|nr:DUF4870 domain-containing protein [Aquisalimonas sp. 2447]
METPASTDTREVTGTPNKTWVIVVYVLYLVGYFTAITALVGVIMAYVKRQEATPVEQSHLQFQIRTFWIGLLMIVGGSILTAIVIGGLVLLFWFVWTLVRCIKGLMRINEGRGIDEPTSWLFG